MRKLNNKGFAISTILFSILIIFVSVLIVSYSTLASNPDRKPAEQCPNGCENTNCICPDKYEEKCPNEFIIGTEHFCPLSIGSNYVVALAKYNLNLGDNIDDNTTVGLQTKKTKEFMVGYVPSITDTTVSGKNYGYYNLLTTTSKVSKYNATTLRNVDELGSNIASPIRGYVNDYKNKLISINSSYNLGITDINVRILNIDDISDESNFNNCKDPHGKRVIDYNNTGDHDQNGYTCSVSEDKKWIFWTESWLGIVDKSKAERLYTLYINGDGFSKSFGGHYTDIAGVRPVIEITRNDYNKLPKA